MRTERRLSLRITSELSQITWVGVSVRSIAVELGLDAIAAAEVELAVVEIVNNSVEHAYQLQPGHPIEVQVEAAAGALVVEIIDGGRSMDPCLLSGARCDDPLAEGGRGLAIARELMEHTRYTAAPGRNVFRMSRRLPSSSPESP